MKFALCLHAHQPPGNFDSVFRECFDQGYGPFLDLLEQHPGIRVSLHISGPLLEWIEQHEPGYLEQLRALVQQERVEPVTAGLYEPVLSLWPSRDRVGQVRAHRAELRRLLGRDASVGWLTERVWEQALTADLVDAGIEIAPLDDQHFFGAGIAPDAVTRPYETEYHGRRLLLAPAPGDIRHAIPWWSVRRALDLVRRYAREGAPMLVYADDLEKFGVWPGTYRTVYEQGWLSRFFAGLERMGDEVEVVPLGEAVRETAPAGLTYLPDASYPEMLEWSLTVDAHRRLADAREAAEAAGTWEALRPFVRPGAYRLFLAKYPEVNYLHKRVLDLSESLADTTERLSDRDVEHRRLPATVRQLWRAQANDAYWHGLFGGTYLPHLRHAPWASLIQAERRVRRGRSVERLREVDLDADGAREIAVTGSAVSAVVSPRAGGSVIELSLHDPPVNLGDTLARRPESYHEGVRLPRGFAYDDTRRALFLDSLLPAGRPPAAGRELEPLHALTDDGYAVSGLSTKGRSAAIRLEREVATESGLVRMEKTIVLPLGGTQVEVRYLLTPIDGSLRARFATEINLGVFFAQQPDGRTCAEGAEPIPLQKVGTFRGADAVAVELRDPALRIAVGAGKPADIRVRPIETLSRSEAGFERIPQCLSVLLSWPLALEAGERWEMSVTLDPGTPEDRRAGRRRRR